jgi:hypothetical protein
LHYKRTDAIAYGLNTVISSATDSDRNSSGVDSLSE